MKILVLNYEYPPIGGGAGTFSRILSEKLHERGHEINVVTMAYKDLKGPRDEDGVKVYRIPCIRKHESSCMPWEQLTYIMSLKRFMKNHPELTDSDVCLSHFVVPSALGARSIKKKYSMKYVIKACGSDVRGYNSRLLFRFIHFFIQGMWRNIVRDSFATVAPSGFMKKLLRSNYDKGNYVLIPNGLDIKTDETYEKERKILLMGRMQETKNFQTAVKALSLCGLSDWEISIVGDGPYREGIEKLVDEGNLRERTTFYGWIENGSEIHSKLLIESSVYITASRFENCPNAVLEAAAAGCELILSDIDAHREMIGDQACYFEADDYKSLAEIINKVTANCRSPKKYDIERYSFEKVIPAYEKLLKEAAEDYGKQK